MDLAAKLQKIARMDSRALPAEQVVEMATITGARALHLEKQIGSLEPGKKADLILVDTTAPHAHADVQRLFATGLRAEGQRRENRRHRRENRDGRSPDADAERTGNSGEGPGIQKANRRIPGESRREVKHVLA